MLFVTAVIGAIGYNTIHRHVEDLRTISHDNLLWTANQMEVELLRFELSVANLVVERSQEALDDVHERFEILWSRVAMMQTGRVGKLLRQYDKTGGALEKIADFLRAKDEVIAGLKPEDTAQAEQLLRELHRFEQPLRLYALEVVRSDNSAASIVRDRIQSSAQATATISLIAVMISLLSVFLILRENRRQRIIAELSRLSAEQAESANRAKSRFLTMMSHELRNPLNGVLGPLALLDQSDIPPRQKRLVEQAHQSGQSMLRMLSSLLDYGEVQDGRMRIRHEPLRLNVLAGLIEQDLEANHPRNFTVSIDPDTPTILYGDMDRFRQIFVHLCEFASEIGKRAPVSLRFGFQGEELTGEISFVADRGAIGWKFDLLTEMTESGADQVSSEAFRPIIMRNLITAANGVLTLVDRGTECRVIRVTIPTKAVEFQQIRVHLETRSSAMRTIYQAALRSERVIFVPPDMPGEVDMVLVDATSISSDYLMSQLRGQYPRAMFVSLGCPQSPDLFDDIVEKPNDVGSLRSSILGRLAS